MGYETPNIDRLAREALRSEAEEINYKAQHIRIPNDPNGLLVVEYYIDRKTGAFSHFEIVPRDRSRPAGATRGVRTLAINMRVPREFKGYDKLGYRKFIRSLKEYIFGNPSARISKERAEKFFSDPRNFAE